MRRVVVVSLVVVVVAMGFAAVAGESGSNTSDLKSDIWVVMFCPELECEESSECINIMEVCQQAFPEFGYATTIQAAKDTESREITFDVDPTGYYRRFYAVEQQQVLVVLAQGLGIKRLSWPFSVGDALRTIAQASLIAPTVPVRVDLIGMEAPNFFATDRLGRQLSLVNLEFPVLLAFMSTSCPGCLSSVPALCSLRESVSVNLLISGDDREAFDSRLREEDCSYLMPWFVDDTDFLFRYSLRWSPSYVYIDEEGIVAGIHEGRADEEDLLALIGSAAVQP